MELPSRRVMLFVSLPLLLVVLLVAIYFLTKQLEKETPPLPIQTGAPKSAEGIPPTLTLLRSSSTNPLSKTYLTLDQKVRYSMRGKIVDPLEEANGVWQGAIVLTGDPLERKITILVGSGDNQVYLGEYEGDFTGNSRWSLGSMEKLLKTHQYDDELEFVVDLSLPLPDLDQNLVPEILSLDALQVAFETGEHEAVELPTTFALYSYQVGYVAR